MLNSFNVPNIKTIPPNSANSLMTALEYGPVVASIRAGNAVFRHYATGIIDSEECTAKSPGLKMDHAVLVVGSGYTSRNQPYFVIFCGDFFARNLNFVIGPCPVDNNARSDCGLTINIRYTDTNQDVAITVSLVHG